MIGTTVTANSFSVRYFSECAGVAELADAQDLKSWVRKGVWVRFPSPAFLPNSVSFELCHDQPQASARIIFES